MAAAPQKRIKREIEPRIEEWKTLENEKNAIQSEGESSKLDREQLHTLQEAWYERDEAASLLEGKRSVWTKAARALRAVRARDAAEKSEPGVIDLRDAADRDGSCDEDYVGK